MCSSHITKILPNCPNTLHFTDLHSIKVGCGGSLVDSSPFVRRVAGSNPTLAATVTLGKSLNHIHSFIQANSIAPLQVRYTSEALPIARILCQSFTPKCHAQLRFKDLPKVPTWRLERDSNPQPSGQKASTLPMRHHAPHHACGGGASARNSDKVSVLRREDL